MTATRTQTSVDVISVLNRAEIASRHAHPTAERSQQSVTQRRQWRGDASPSARPLSVVHGGVAARSVRASWLRKAPSQVTA